MRELISSGRLKSATRASRDGRSWEPLDQFTEVKDLVNVARPAPAIEQQQAERLRLQLRGMQNLPAHEVFGLAPNATLDDLRKAFFRMAKRFSPENFGPETPLELRKVTAEICDFLARRMREAEAQILAGSPRPPPPRLVPTDAPAAPAFTYEGHEFVGLQERNGRLQIDIQVSARTVGIFTDHRISNLQSGALFIHTDRPLGLGTRVELVLHFDRPHRVIKARSAVVWEYSLADGKQPRGYGLGLADLRAEDRAFVEEFVRNARSAGVVSPR
jgi:uncharacterized protein (TIGR02266 family)